MKTSRNIHMSNDKKWISPEIHVSQTLLAKLKATISNKPEVFIWHLKLKILNLCLFVCFLNKNVNIGQYFYEERKWVTCIDFGKGTLLYASICINHKEIHTLCTGYN